MTVIYLPDKFKFDWTKCFQVIVRRQKCWTDMDKPNEWNLTNLKSNLGMMMIYFPVKFEFDWTKLFRVTVRKRKC